MHRSLKGLLTVRSNVPYSGAMAAWLAIYNLPLATLETPSRWYERAFLAWETVRRVRNPFFIEGTGFEGYYIDLCHSPEEMTERLLVLGHDMLASHDRLYPYDTRFKSRLMRVLTGETDDLKALLSWSALLGATLARLRAWAVVRPAAGAFQAETYRMTSVLPGIVYTPHDHWLAQAYTIPFPMGLHTDKLDISPEALKPADQDAALIVWTVGKLGHPLVRQYLSERSR